jgi:hypothetical protein
MEIFVALTVLIVVGLFAAVMRRKFAGEDNKAEQIRATMQELHRYHSKRYRGKSHDPTVVPESE